MTDESPQVENGHIDIANELAEALMRTNLTAYQSRILWVIWRKTYGWHKKEDRIPVSQIVQMTGIKQGHVSRTLKELADRKMVFRKGKVTAFNKRYNEWIETGKGTQRYKNIPDGVYIPDEVLEYTQRGINNIPDEGNSKETQKKLTKENIYIVIFAHWNFKKIIIHQKLTELLKRNIKTALKERTQDEIIKAIDNYAEVIHSDKHYWTYKWTLSDFLKRGLERFLDEADQLNNFLIRNKPTGIRRETKAADFHYDPKDFSTGGGAEDEDAGTE